MFSFDLKSGYHHVEICKGHQTYLGFSWKLPFLIRGKFYVFTVLPFGLSSAPHVFTKLVKPLEKPWRYQGICVVKLTNTIDSIIASDFFLSTIRLTSFTGQIISTAPVSGNISRIMTRQYCTMSTLSSQHWDSKVKMDSYCIEELYFWKNNLNSIKLRNCFLFNKPQRFAYSNASATGCGSVITLNEDCVCHKL